MIDHRLLKPAGAAVLAGAAAAALTVGQSAFAVSGAAVPTHTAPVACTASGSLLRTAPAPPAGHPGGCHPGMRHGAQGTGPRPGHQARLLRYPRWSLMR
jgi:hypothetical protein